MNKKPSIQVSVKVTPMAQAERTRRLMLGAVTAVPHAGLAVHENHDMMPIDVWEIMAKRGAIKDRDGYGFYSDGMFSPFFDFSDEAMPADEEHETFESTLSSIWNEPIPTHYTPSPSYQVRPSMVRRGTLNPPAWATHIIWLNN